MSTLLIGFDSAWTPNNAGAIVGVLRTTSGALRELGTPQIADFPKAAHCINSWRALGAATTIVLLDQPTIVPNESGQRPVENVVSSSISLRYGGMQPASKSRIEMFGGAAPLWGFLQSLGGAADPLAPAIGTRVYETYPALTIIAMGWAVPDTRPSGRLPKYNPQRKKTFSHEDWRHVCGKVQNAIGVRGLPDLREWVDRLSQRQSPKKADQDKLDACICLLTALHLVEGRECLMVGDTSTGYIVVPTSRDLRRELENRCRATGRDPEAFVREFTVEVAGD